MQGNLKATVEGKKNNLGKEFQPKWWGDTLGLYVHVPFCATACDFCAFYQVQSDREGIRRYLDGMQDEAEAISLNQGIDTCFWGGGTPGLLKAEDLDRLCDVVINRFGRPKTEWSVEMAPSTVKADKLKVLKERGVTRISMGVQSFDDGLLDKLGRQHSQKQVLKAYDLIREFDFDSVNLDLIFAIPGQDEERLKADIRTAAALEPDHLSTYCLTFEEDTALFVQLSEGKVSIDQEMESRLYRTSWEMMAELGYEQYEVSNYARPGKRCAHNVNTWNMDQWIGLGPSGASQFRGRRYANVPDLAKWLEARDGPESGRVDESDLTPELLMEDCLIFGLRMNDGVDLGALEARFDTGVTERQASILSQLEEEGKLIREGSIIRLTDDGRMIADAIGAELME
jgi:oxygen-independent coproporphyrinogen-3 oxidase|tara:strand:+ start:784 stop:1980 length:1197 start_codon:yes stop_codon:yes gene_type:complete